MCAERRHVPNLEGAPTALHEFREGGRDDTARVAVLHASPDFSFAELIATEEVLEFVVHLKWRREKSQ